MTLIGLIKKISGKTVEESRRQENWNFPLKEFVRSQTVYTIPEHEATEEEPALRWIAM